jgi:hypothetical protein
VAERSSPARREIADLAAFAVVEDQRRVETASKEPALQDGQELWILAPASATGRPPLEEPEPYFFLPGTLIFLMRPAARCASLADSKPRIAENFLPTTCAMRKERLIPASAMQRAIA